MYQRALYLPQSPELNRDSGLKHCRCTAVPDGDGSRTEHSTTQQYTYVMIQFMDNIASLAYILYVMFFETIQIPRISISIGTLVYSVLPHAGNAIHPA